MTPLWADDRLHDTTGDGSPRPWRGRLAAACSELTGIFGFAVANGGVDEVNAWDYVRYGTLSTGEQIIASNPPSGVLDSGTYADLDRFTVTFDGPNYVYIDDVTVEISGGGEPSRILKTRRRENDGPETVEIVLDRPLGMDETTRFIFDDGTSVNVVQYTLRPVPAASAWGLLVLALMITCAGTVVLRRRAF